MNFIPVALLLVFACQPLHAGQYSYEKLTGSATTTRFDFNFQGAAGKARNELFNISKIDSVREDSRTRRAASTPIVSNTSSGSSGKRFTCEYSCSTSGNILYSGGSTKAATTSVMAKDRFDAEKEVEKSLWSNKTCQGMKTSSGLSMLPKAVCKE
jgi:hypothetical protein